MNKSIITGFAAGAVAATAIGGVAGYHALHSPPNYAQVLAVHPAVETTRVPQRICREVAVSEQAPVRDPNRIAGTAVGAVLGGVLGNQIGGGSGKTLATVAGVAAGGYAGNQVQRNMQQSDRRTVMETRCRTLYRSHSRNVGYDVSYRLDGRQGVVRMDRPPGARIPVKDGRLVLTPGDAQHS